jgi:hypothetical protein
MEAFTILHSSDNPYKRDTTFQTQSGLDQHKRYNQVGKKNLKKDSSKITNYAVSFWQHESFHKPLQLRQSKMPYKRKVEDDLSSTIRFTVGIVHGFLRPSFRFCLLGQLQVAAEDPF